MLTTLSRVVIHPEGVEELPPKRSLKKESTITIYCIFSRERKGRKDRLKLNMTKGLVSEVPVCLWGSGQKILWAKRVG